MFTFKTIKPTGKWRAFNEPTHEIKVGGCVVGSIEHSPPHKIRFMVTKKDINEDGNPNCTWRWITLKKESESLADVKDWLKCNYNIITRTFNLFKIEP